ncbi:sulfite exporter TauE/SafE family protein [Telmatobacter bradus]|uniref:sulfite exporter TauE/SafE family protein n=1 Tax=Telmatobacter bradus TaxID=474953 RepID=UPI003B4367B2
MLGGSCTLLLARSQKKKARRTEQFSMSWLALLLGVLVGAVSGVVGIGGGILFVPALIVFFGMSQHKAQGTSLGALLLPVGLLAFLEYYRKGNADLRVAALLAAGFLVGGLAGAYWAQDVSDLLLRRIFAVLLVALGGWFFFQR